MTEPRVPYMTMFESFYKAFEDLPTDEERVEFIRALCRKAFYDEDTECTSSVKVLLTLSIPNVEKSVSNYLKNKRNGSKGGAPIGNQNARKYPKHKPEGK